MRIERSEQDVAAQDTGMAPLARPWTDPAARLLFGGFLTLIVIFGVSRFFYTPLLPVMQRDFGFGIDTAALLASVNLGAYVAGSLLASLVGPGRARLAIFRVSMVASVAAIAGMGLTDSVVAWVVLRLVAGVASAFGLILAAAMIAESLAPVGEESRVGWIFAGMGVGIVATGLLVAPASAHLGSSLLWLIGGAGSALTLPFIFRTVKVTKVEPRPQRVAQLRHQPRPLPFWPLLFTYSIGGIGFTVFSTFIVAIVKSRPAIAPLAEWAWIITGLAAIPSGIGAAWLAGRIGFANALVAVYLVQITSLLLPAVSESGAVTMLAAVLFGLTLVATPVLVSALGRHGVGGRGFAVLTFGGGIGQMLGPIITAQVVQAPQDYATALLASVLATSTGVLVLVASMYFAYRPRR